MSDVITYLRDRRAVKKQAKALQPEKAQPQTATETMYNERLHVRSLLHGYSKLLAIGLIIGVTTTIAWSLLSSAGANYLQIQSRTTQLDTKFDEFLNALGLELGWTNTGVISVLTTAAVIALIVAGLMIVLAIYPRLYEWQRSRIIVDETGIRIVDKEILKTGGTTEYSVSVLRGSNVRRTFLDRLFINCGTVEIFMMDMSGDNDALKIHSVKKPDKLQRVIRNIVTSRTELEKGG